MTDTATTSDVVRTPGATVTADEGPQFTSLFLYGDGRMFYIDRTLPLRPQLHHVLSTVYNTATADAYADAYTEETR